MSLLLKGLVLFRSIVRLLLFNILLVSQSELAGCIAECLLIAWWIEGLLFQVFCLIWNCCFIHFVHVWVL